MTIIGILVFIFILGLLIFVHELGHFVAARRAGMRVDEFGFGFPPRLFGVKRGNTIYSINWIPLGGFVKIAGEDGDEQGPNTFSSKSFGKRFLTLIAGVTMNALLAWILFSIVLMIGLPTQISGGEKFPSNAKIEDRRIAFLYVEPDSPAERAGMRPGDTLLAIDGMQFASHQQVLDFVTTKPGEILTLSIQRGSEQLEATVLPRVNPPEGQGMIGVLFGEVANVSYPWYTALVEGFRNVWYLTIQIFSVLGTLLKNLVTDQPALSALTGPIGIAVLTRDAVELGIANVIYLASLLSINLAIINALPFPALDGGRILFLIVEKIRGKKLNEAFERYANMIGFFLLLTLMVWVTVKDVGRFGGELKSVVDQVKSIL